MLRLTEGFEWDNSYTAFSTQSNSNYLKWAISQSGSCTCSISTAAGRFKQGWRTTFSGNSAGAQLIYSQPSAQNVANGQFIIGFAFRISEMPASNISIAVHNGGTSINGTTNLVNVTLTTTGQLRIGSQTSSTTFCDTGFTGTALVANTWYYIELKLKTNTTGTCAAGDAQIQLNGSVVCTVAAGQTNGAGLRSASGIHNSFLGPTSTQTGYISGMTIDYDDIYIADNTGSYNNTFLGDCTVETIYPSADGSNSTWTPTPSGAGTNWQRVSEAPPDNDTTYVATTQATGQMEGYLFNSLSTIPNAVYGVSCQPVVRDDTNSEGRHPNLYVKSNGTTSSTVAGSNQGPYSYIPGTYAAYWGIFETDPSTSSPWTVSGINAMEAGLTLT